jgi:hypothetical protein
MTTNIYDQDARKLASDSRWSINSPEFVLFIDDTGFDKIFSHSNIVMMFAGDGMLIQLWKDWLVKPNIQSIPPVSNGDSSIAICMVNTDTSTLLFGYGQNIYTGTAWFAGSGSIHAADCWKVNKNPCLAIESAKKADILSGGTVKYFDYANKVSNLENRANIADVHKEIINRGLVMYKIDSSTAVPINEAAKNDSKVRDLVQAIQAGSVTASAPCDAMYNEWPSEKIAELHGVLKNVFSTNVAD